MINILTFQSTVLQSVFRKQALTKDFLQLRQLLVHATSIHPECQQAGTAQGPTLPEAHSLGSQELQSKEEVEPEQNHSENQCPCAVEGGRL